MHNELNDFLDDFSGNDPVSPLELREAEQALGRRLPAEFIDLLSILNGGEGFVGDKYLMIWSAGEIVDYSAQYDVQKYAPGLVVFGSNGGGEAYAFDYRSERTPVVKIPFVGMDLKHVREMALTFIGFLQKLKNE